MTGLSFVDLPLDLADLLLQLVGVALCFTNVHLDLHRSVEMEVKELVQALLEVRIEADSCYRSVSLIRGPARLENKG